MLWLINFLLSENFKQLQFKLMKIDTEIVAAKSNQNAPNTTPISLKLEAIDQAKCVVIYFYSVQGTVDLVLFPKTAQSS